MGLLNDTMVWLMVVIAILVIVGWGSRRRL